MGPSRISGFSAPKIYGELATSFSHVHPLTCGLMANRRGKILVAVPIVLVAIAGALGAWVFHSLSWKGPQTGESITIRELNLERDYGNGILTVHFTFKNKTSTPVVLAPPAVMLITGGDDMVDLFKLPNSQESRQGVQVAPGYKQQTALKFWLKPEHLKGELFLVNGEEKAKIKSATPVSFDGLADDYSAKIRSVDWALE